MRFDKELRLAVEAAEKAGAFLKEHIVKVDASVGRDIKLENDRRSEEIIVNILKETDLPILSEERGMTAGCLDTELRWIVDPLDGSANLWKGMNELTCVSVALWQGKEPILGVVNRFHVGELFSGVVGEGAFLNGTPIHTSDIREMKSAVLGTGFPVKRSYDSENLNLFITQIQNFKKIRMLGAAALTGAFVSCGRIDAYREEDIMIWDVAAASALVKAAGGFAEVIPTAENQVVCNLFSNQELFDAFRKLDEN